MNVGKLKKILATYPDDVEVVLSSDEEGNSFHKLEYVSDGVGWWHRTDRDFFDWQEEDEIDYIAGTETWRNECNKAICLYP